ncbi:sugar-binding domain-containing protein [Leeuwenhoekiella blandensis]|uniref:Beta-galactosidase n=1 Tax=Leeuwenhoekiella blandensis (strain CECT 7118 / CCUG 51940 / KCTC 22103 / MED217) TaxID=398720 RepID=A3XNL5_LEEBM|nr:sugar-binding domain-containing protein [Leeuwenhoekiella blandensis]EAQ48859.1 beta-galactosidase [Leeuwenhoekiella blandensis MED217]
MKKPNALLAVFVFVLSMLPLKAQQNLDKTSKTQNFDHGWKFSLSADEKAIDPNFDDSGWEDLVLPHDWSVQFPLAQENPSAGAGGYFKNGLGWYRKTFQVPEELENKKIYIHFGGVYMNAEVFVNGRSVGIQPYGYSPFYFDISEYLKFGEQNVITVKVDNSEEINSRWFSGSGIYRHVKIQVNNPLHFETNGVAINTSEVDKNKASVHISPAIINETKTIQEYRVTASVETEEETFKSELALKNVPGEIRKGTLALELPNPRLWSPDNPNLYTLKLAIKNSEGKIIDEVEETFGIRTIEYNSKDGFVLNGKSVLINGGNMHHDNGALGAAAFDRAEIRKVQLLKDAGFNSVRTSHNVPSEAFLKACDSIGLLVIDEAFDGWRTEKTPYDYARYFDLWYKKDIQAMVARDRNHPSIVMWSIGNEIIERKDPEAVKTAQLLKNAVLELDTTRPVTSAMTTWDNDWQIFDPLFSVHDIGGYNYQLHRAESDHERVPERVMVQTESYPRDAFFCWDMTQKHQYVIGDYVWTAMDYLGESGIGRFYIAGEEPDGEHWSADHFPWHGAYCGDIDLIGWRKPISHYRDMLWNNSEKIYMAVKQPNPEGKQIKETMWSVWPTWPSWTWPQHVGKPITVEVYTKYPEVKLYLNNRLIEAQQVSRETEFIASFDVEYQPGTLVAKAFENGVLKESTLLQTAKAVDQIKLTAENNTLVANAQDLAYIQVELQDEEGILNPTQDQLLDFTVEGPAEIIATDNANLKDTTAYPSHSRKTWNGRALVILRSTSEKGDILLKVTNSKKLSNTIKIKSI